jgi:hypothetical protein
LKREPIIDNIKSEVEDSKSATKTYEVSSYPADFTLSVLFEKWNNDEILIRDFQRYYVWKPIQASKLIESFLLGLPVPGIFLYKEKATQKLIVIDGQQRLMSVFGYFIGKFPGDDNFPDNKCKDFILDGVNDKWKGKSYEELPIRDQRKLRDSVLRAIIINQIKPQDFSSISEIYFRLNTGGTTLTPQEIRNAIYSGDFNNLLKNLNLIEVWRRITGKENPDKRMRDVELILRFFGLYYDLKKYHKPMKAFLDEYMLDNRGLEKRGPREYEKLFNNTSEAIYNSLGPKPFNIKRGINVAVYDSVMLAFAKNSRNIPENIRSRYNSLIKHDDYLSLVTSATTDVDVVRKRIEMAHKVLFR